MMSPEDIPEPEWNRLRKLAAEAADALARNDPQGDSKAEKLLLALRQLRDRYGDLPSIIREQLFQEEFVRR